jgi:small-conductance mechanosensitive channel
MPIEVPMLNRLNPLTWPVDWEAFGAAALIAGVAVLVSLVVHRAAFKLLARMAHMSETPLDDQIIAHTRRPVRWVLVMVALGMAAQLDPHLAAVWNPIARFLHPALLGWIAYILVKVATEMLEYRLDAADPVQVRGRRTRLSILSRTATAVIVIITLGLMLFALPGVRDIGTTLLASAGLAALAVGAAAQPALKSLIAGVQMAVNEPIRLGDLVVVDGHTGRVEEIHMSYVIVRTWDERAVIVPTSVFLEQTFENWSRKNERLTGPVFLRLHPETDIDRVRAEFEAFLKTQPTWDGRTGTLFMTEAFIDYVELRLAVSAATIADLFTLRSAVREHMIAWLRAEMPDALARATPVPPTDMGTPPRA